MDARLRGEAERLKLFLLLWRTNAAGALLRDAGRALLGTDLVVYVIDVVDPVGYAVALAMRSHGIEDIDHMIRCANARTPPERALLWGATSAALLADVVDRIAPQIEGLAEQIRAPAHADHVRALIVAGAGAELVQVSAVDGALTDIHRPCDPRNEGT